MIVIFIGNQPDPEDRLKLRISDADYAKIPPRGSRSTKIVKVTDLRTKQSFFVRRASCGLAKCWCALELAVKP
jgi:hypothetical protein